MKNNFKLHYNDYTIEAKKDLGNTPHMISGFGVMEGYVVVKDHCNIMPGATWFQSVVDARRACDVLDRVGEKGFWQELRLVDAISNAFAKAGHL
jgi:hypothetical protein